VTRNASIAAAATLIIRFCTLWLGVAVGMVGLVLAASQLRGIDLTTPTNPGDESPSASIEVVGR